MPCGVCGSRTLYYDLVESDEPDVVCLSCGARDLAHSQVLPRVQIVAWTRLPGGGPARRVRADVHAQAAVQGAGGPALELRLGDLGQALVLGHALVREAGLGEHLGFTAHAGR
jgi:hypothetical protein